MDKKIIKLSPVEVEAVVGGVKRVDASANVNTHKPAAHAIQPMRFEALAGK